MNERPISPHLQIYRLPLTALLSISHRATGVVLVIGLAFVPYYLVALAEGVEPFALVQASLGSIGGKILLWAWTYSLFFHLCHGLRHLLWDAGFGFDKATLNRDAWFELAGSLLLTGICLLLT